ncbi:CPBP family intramembrane glutamic endopeptidase [Anaerocolumna xylanovorans]|nr:CPBP family intramembrane glutamic endopeptidase [Anaerocolumna xylanovorans]
MHEDFVIQKHSALRTILMHLIPGLINLIIMLLILPIIQYFGLISLTAGFLMVPIAMVPVQFGILLYTAKKTTGTYKIGKLIPYQKKAKIMEYLLFIVIIIVWAMLVGRILEPLENCVRDGLFSFVPDHIALRNIDLTLFSKDSLVFTAILGILANGIIAPVTEELYFRGFLLPRINLSPIGAAVANASLFSLYHFFSPWYFFSRLLTMVPIYYWVIKRQNIRFSLTAHIIANLYTAVGILAAVLALE